MTGNSAGVQTAVLIGLSVVYVGISAIGSVGFAHTGIGRFDVAIGLVVPFSIAFGGPGILAGGLGVLARDVISGALSADTVVIVLSHLLAGYLTYRLSGILSLQLDRSPQRWVSWIGRYIGISLVAGMAAAAAIGWGFQLLARAPFYLAWGLFLQYLSASLLLGLPTFLVIVLLDRRIERVEVVEVHAHASPVYVSTVVSAWFALGVLGSVGYYNLERIPAWALHDIGLGVLAPIGDLWLLGPGAVHAQTLLAATAIAALVAILRISQRGPTR